MTHPVAKDARLQYYVDADLLGLAKLLVQVRSDITYPGDPGGVCPDRRLRPPSPISQPKTDDDVWLPIVAEAGWIVITKDSAIGRTPRLRDLANEYRSRLIAVASRDKMRNWDHLVAVAAQWHRIEGLRSVPGPWMYRVSRTTITQVPGIGRRP